MTVYVDNGATAGAPYCLLFADTPAELADFTTRLDPPQRHRRAGCLPWHTVTAHDADRAILFGAIPVDWRDTRRILARAAKQGGDPA